jgi:hypothetical protein
MRFLKLLGMIFLFVSIVPAQETSTPAEPGPNAQVIFSRSTSDNQDSTQSPAAATADAAKAPSTPITDAERQAITFLSYDLEVHLEPAQQAMAVRARMTLRNDGDAPLRLLPLEISATLKWTGFHTGDKSAAFVEHPVLSDTDHTGRLDEAIVTLAQPLAPKASIAIEATYAGTVPLSSQRLEQIGTPQDAARHSDWDRISEDFVGLRGFGDVVWYPVASVPVALGDGNKLFDEVADQRMRQMGAMVSIEVTEEFFHSAPNLAVLDGKPFALVPASLPSASSVPGIVTVSLPPTRLGFASPSLFLANRTEHDGAGLKIFTRPEDEANVPDFTNAAAMVAPVIAQWLGPRPGKPVEIIDLPEPEDASFEDGVVLLTSVRNQEPKQLAGTLLHSLTHAHFTSPYPWLEEGAASFMGTLWVESNQDRAAALEKLESERGALSLIEPDGSPDEGESLLRAKDAVYYRTKAAYVLWMLRDLAGDDALALAFNNYNPAADANGMEFEDLLEQTTRKDLKWFFNDWVYHDRGLPDLSIAGVFPSTANVPGSYIVAVNVLNSGSAEAEVPVSVRSDATTVTERLRVPALSEATHRFLIQGQPEEVTVNDGTIPEAGTTIHSKSLSFQP